MSDVEYVLAQQDMHAPEQIVYMRAWTGIGPQQTHDLDLAERFPSEQAAMQHPAYAFALTFYRPCPVVGDIVGRPVDWLEAEENAAKQILLGEDPGDGLRVFA